MKPITVLSIASLLLILPGGAALAADNPCLVPSFIEETVQPIATKGAITLPASADAVTLGWPIASFVLNSPFGPRQLGSAGARFDWHRGTDLKVPIGTSVVAPADAFVVFSGNHPSFADPVIQLRHNTVEPYLYSLYLHMSVTSAVAGETIAAGTEIGLSGQGTSSYPHLHWEVRRGCLRQECCQNVYGYMTVGSTLPPLSTVAAAGDSASFGRMLLLEYSFPEDELDFQGVQLTWGAESRVADLDDMNVLSPLGQGSLLDDPLWFVEEHAHKFAILPQRFNESFDSADYQFLAWDLPAVNSGSVKVLDAMELETTSALNINLPPMTIVASPETTIKLPGSAVEIVYTITNNDATPRTIDLAAVSAQSLTINLSESSVVLGAGASTNVTLSTTLPGDFPEDVGDVLLLIATMQGGGWTPLLASTLVDTSNDTGVDGWMMLVE